MRKLDTYIEKQREEVGILDKKQRELFTQAYKVNNKMESKRCYINELSCIDDYFKWYKSKLINYREIPYSYFMFSFYRPHTNTSNRQDIYIYLYYNENNKKFKYRVKVDSMLDINDFTNSTYHKVKEVEFLQTSYIYDIIDNTKDKYFDEILKLDKVNKNFRTEKEATQYIHELIKQFNVIIRENKQYKEYISICGEEYDKLDTIVNL